MTAVVFSRLVRIVLLSALIGALSAPAALAQDGLTQPSLADVPPVVDAVVEQAADVVPAPVDVAPAIEAVQATVATASDIVAAPPPPVVPPLPVAPPALPSLERAASPPLAVAEAPPAPALRVAERAPAPTTRTASPKTPTRRLEPVAANPATPRSAATAAVRSRDDQATLDRSRAASPAPTGSPPAARTAVATAPARAHCLPCQLSPVQAGLGAAAGVGFGLLFGALTLALLFSPVLLALRQVLSAARLLPVLVPRLERPG